MVEGDDALISIKPKYAQAILDGTKTVELRRRIPFVRRGTTLWIYATRPRSAIVGSAVIDEIIEGSPTEIWDKCMDRTAVTRCEFDEYFVGTERALALVLSNVVRRREIGIEKLRELSEGFHPPQVLTRLSREESVWLSRRAKSVELVVQAIPTNFRTTRQCCGFRD